MVPFPLRQHRTIHGTHLACIIFRHIVQKSSAIHQVLPAVFDQSDENSACAICAPELCGIALSIYALMRSFDSASIMRRSLSQPPCGGRRLTGLAAARSGAALTFPRHVIHYRAPASQPSKREPGRCGGDGNRTGIRIAAASVYTGFARTVFVTLVPLSVAAAKVPKVNQRELFDRTAPIPRPSCPAGQFMEKQTHVPTGAIHDRRSIHDAESVNSSL